MTPTLTTQAKCETLPSQCARCLAGVSYIFLEGCWGTQCVHTVVLQ